MDKIKRKIDSSGWYYNWVIYKGRARDEMKDIGNKVEANIDNANLSIQVWLWPNSLFTFGP